jgi:hypothetical protein
MRPIAFGEALLAKTRLTLFSDDKPDRFFTVVKFWMDGTSGVALALRGGVPSYQVEDEEGRIHLLIHLPFEEEHDDRWCLWRPDHAGFDSRSICWVTYPMVWCVTIALCTSRSSSLASDNVTPVDSNIRTNKWTVSRSPGYSLRLQTMSPERRGSRKECALRWECPANRVTSYAIQFANPLLFF